MEDDPKIEDFSDDVKKDVEKLAEKIPKIKIPKIAVPKLKLSKLATIFSTLIVGIFIGALILTLVNVGVSQETAGEKAAEYITGNFLGAQGMTAEVAEVAKEGGYYAVNINIMQGGSKKDEAIVYVSKDGKSLFIGSAYDMTEKLSPITGATTAAVPEVPKSDKPVVELFIMSYCPYGLQMQKGFLPVMKLFGDKIEASVKWVHYIMHGEKEATENTRQYCIQEEQQDKYFDYANCFVLAGEVDKCLGEARIDRTKLTKCMNRVTEEFKVAEDIASGEQFPKYKVTMEESQGYGVQGSPAIVINGKMVSIGRDAESIKKAICAAFNTEPSECEETLDTASPSPGLGGGTGSSESGYCG